MPALYPPCHTGCHTSPQGEGFRVELIPHALPIIDIGVLLALLALAAWWELRKCSCQKGE